MARLERFELQTLGTGIRLNAISVVGCFSVWLYFKGFFDVPFCSFFLCFVFSLQRNCNKKLEQKNKKKVFEKPLVPLL